MDGLPVSGQPCAWDSPTAYRFCYTHKAWTETVADVCPVAAEVQAASKLAADLAAENVALRAQVQRVRRLCAQHDLLRTAEVFDALDGGGA
jgi:hypothetical protein